MALEALPDSQLEEWVRNFRKSGSVVYRTPDPGTYVIVECTISVLLETRKLLQVTNQLFQVTDRLFSVTRKLTTATYVLLAATILLLITEISGKLGL